MPYILFDSHSGVPLARIDADPENASLAPGLLAIKCEADASPDDVPRWKEAATTAQPELSEMELLLRAQATKIVSIDAETAAALTAGFFYVVDGVTYHFSYDTFDQQNFADTANVALLSQMGGQGLPESVAWNAYKNWQDGKGELVRLTFTAETFLALYTAGAVAHKAARMAEGGSRKEAVAAAVARGATVEELEAI